MSQHEPINLTPQTCSSTNEAKHSNTVQMMRCLGQRSGSGTGCGFAHLSKVALGIMSCPGGHHDENKQQEIFSNACNFATDNTKGVHLHEKHFEMADSWTRGAATS